MTIIRAVTKHERSLLAKIARLHCACLPLSSVTELGESYARHFYLMLARSPSDHVLAAVDGETVKGALVLSERPGLLPIRMLAATPLALFAAGRAVRSWRIEGGAPASMPHRGGPLLGGAELRRLKALPELTNLFVGPAHRDHGVGARLVASCADLCRAKGLPAFFIKTDAEAGNPALRFYGKLGAERIGVVESRGRRFAGFVLTA